MAITMADIGTLIGTDIKNLRLSVKKHLEQDDAPSLDDVKPGDTWWDTDDNKLYQCVTKSGDKDWLQIG